MASFETLEAKVNAVVLKKLSNATAVTSGEPFRGMFDSEYNNADIGIAGFGSYDPRLVCAPNDVVDLVEGSPVLINGTPYRLASEVELPGDGFAYLALKK